MAAGQAVQPGGGGVAPEQITEPNPTISSEPASAALSNVPIKA